MDEFVAGKYLMVVSGYNEDHSLALRLAALVPMKMIAILAKERIISAMGSMIGDGELSVGDNVSVDIYEVKDSLLNIDNLVYIDMDS